MKIGDDRITVSLDRATNFLRQIGRDGRAVEQNPTRGAQEAVSPRKNNAATNQADHWIEPGPAEELPRSERHNREKRCERIGQHMQVCGAKI